MRPLDMLYMESGVRLKESRFMPKLVKNRVINPISEAKVVRDGIHLCDDCTIAAVNDDYTGIDSDERVSAVKGGLSKLGGGLVPNFDSESGKGIREFTARNCDSCGGGHGRKHEFAILGH